jgi:5'(3')-deoxyribonucleotidase
MPRILGCDVDDVLLPMTTIHWSDWCKDKYGSGFDAAISHPVKLYGEESLDFWRGEDIYINKQPNKSVVESLESLSKYFDIVFISKLKGQHHRDKVYWLKKHFPFMKGFIGTHEKYLMNGSVTCMIDDLKKNLKGFDNNKRIWFNANIQQDIQCDVAYEFSEWNDKVVKDICDLYL